MSREIKCRGKRIDNGERVEGDRIEIDGQIFIYPRIEGFCCHEFNSEPRRFIFADNFIEVHPDTVCQFTGLKDKNGKEIYEGDKTQSRNGQYTYSINWQQEYCRYVLSLIEDSCANGHKIGIIDIDLESCEVIGTIHAEKP